MKFSELTDRQIKSIEFEPDYVVGYTCFDCNEFVEIDEGEDDEVSQCEKCGSTSFIFESSHQGVPCAFCKLGFMFMEDAYRGKIGGEELICENCIRFIDLKDD